MSVKRVFISMETNTIMINKGIPGTILPDQKYEIRTTLLVLMKSSISLNIIPCHIMRISAGSC